MIKDPQPRRDSNAPSFSFRSGRLALDFAATLMFRSGRPQELLANPSALAAWTTAAGVIDTIPPVSDGDLAIAVDLREAIYRIAVAVLCGRRAQTADRTLLNRLAAEPPTVPELLRPGRLRWHGDARRMLAVVARDGVELFGSSDIARLRQCEREGCTRLFLDDSRGRNRIWCGMRECGNRVNAAAYRRRHRAAKAGVSRV